MKAKTKKPKIKKISTIRKRLLREWSEAVRSRVDFTCELCGKKKSDFNEKGVHEKIDAHHFLAKEIKDCPLKFDIRNGVAVCPFCHKFGIPSFHRDPIRTITWLMQNRPNDYAFVRDNAYIRIDLENRKVLEEIEMRLLAKEPLDLEKLKKIEERFCRNTKKPELEGNIFDQLAEPKTDPTELLLSS